MKERVALSQRNQREGQKLEALLRMREVKTIPEPPCEGCTAEINVAVYLR
ncbi:hypothetical protein [Eisenbergiella tayi]|nr:hypothetical protein [Eisenbergiella tayi]